MHEMGVRAKILSMFPFSSDLLTVWRLVTEAGGETERWLERGSGRLTTGAVERKGCNANGEQWGMIPRRYLMEWSAREGQGGKA
jgi:hypothetical protein